MAFLNGASIPASSLHSKPKTTSVFHSRHFRRHQTRRCRRGATVSTTTACEPRPETIHTDPSFLPQTIEYAIGESQRATRDALCAGITNLQIELPMGRSRSHWYVMSPFNTWYPEASVLAFHYAEMFKGLHISLILGCGPGVTHSVPWISDLYRLEDDIPPDSSLQSTSKNSIDTSHRVVIFSGIATSQYETFEKRLNEIQKDNVEAIIVFNCFLNVPLSKIKLPSHFQIAYLCRAFNKLAILKNSHLSPWSVFIEIAVFEYEWIGNRDDGDGDDDKWFPDQEKLERFVCSRGAYQKKATAYMRTDFSGCEAGFWPFMTACCRNVLPYDGDLLEREFLAKQEKKKARPFGFF